MLITAALRMFRTDAGAPPATTEQRNPAVSSWCLVRTDRRKNESDAFLSPDDTPGVGLLGPVPCEGPWTRTRANRLRQQQAW